MQTKSVRQKDTQKTSLLFQAGCPEYSLYLDAQKQRDAKKDKPLFDISGDLL
jgi:hypothetical protein